MRTIYILLLLSLSYSATLLVPDEYSTIQSAIDAASDGDSVLVSAGTYFENIIWPATNGIKLIGSGENSTYIDGNELGSVIRFEEDLNGIIDTTTIIMGFTIQNGFFNQDWLETSNGGGMYLWNSSPILTNLTIKNNTANQVDPWGWYPSGGGMYLKKSSPILTNVTISNNTVDGDGYGGGMYGGTQSNPTLSNVTISYNMADGNGGGMWLGGHNLTLSNVTISDNTANDGGGGIYLSGDNPDLSNVTISNNMAHDGGGMYLHTTSPILTNVTISNNIANYGGGGMYADDSSPILTNVTISNNIANYGGGGMYADDSSPILTNCIIWSNSPDEIIHESGNVSNGMNITYSDIMGGWGGNGNIDADPMFCDPENRDFSLNVESPCMYTGESEAIMGALGIGCGDVSIYEPNILSIADIPNDQGGRVFVLFTKSFFDNTPPNSNRDEAYYVQILENEYWTTVGNTPALNDSVYQIIALTLVDSTSDNNGMTEFRVVASLDEGTWISDIAEGYSVDNIIPEPPTSLTSTYIDAVVQLSWSPSPADDLEQYQIYRNDELIMSTASTEYIDSGFDDSCEQNYAVNAVDIHDNNSEFINSTVWTAMLGDMNNDGSFNVLDVVMLANCVLAGTCESNCASDLNGDNSTNILDIVNLVNCILALNCGG